VIEEVFFPEPLVIQPIQKPLAVQSGTPMVGTSPFARIFEEKFPLQGVRFSQHAEERLRSRGITLSASDLKSLAGAMDSVAKKGGKESLIMQGDTAFVVSVANRTVITALDRKSMMDSVVTNIDSVAVI
jgi:flagellar operon protein